MVQKEKRKKKLNRAISEAQQHNTLDLLTSELYIKENGSSTSTGLVDAKNSKIKPTTENDPDA